jgi:hypothetical protein
MGAHKPTALFLYTDLKKEKSPRPFQLYSI